ncbi:MAG: dTDP-4-dehydrorhamnose 3,5-epimerase [Clostridiaceae bacterium]|jgi:dTDP-4-dehydrorhamnose 3,5-epimerase|nr:dTDP-4-dehydrorhamnose 3,5-epimerase [Clostridiaceae bacterium]
MNVISTRVRDVFILEPAVFGDERGWFFESWSERETERHGLLYRFVQDNHSYSAKTGTLRGLHVQKGRHSQAKLVRCVRGAVLDVAVDLRKGSPTYMQWVGVELSAQNKRQLLIPRGFLHGFITRTDDVEFLYKTDNFYNKDSEATVIWNDPDIAVDWGVDSPIINEKDSLGLRVADCGIDFVYSGAPEKEKT